jgi:hypothetical protein
MQLVSCSTGQRASVRVRRIFTDVSVNEGPLVLVTDATKEDSSKLLVSWSAGWLWILFQNTFCFSDFGL